MGKGLARRATETAAAERDDNDTSAGAMLTRVASVALALLLVLQVAGSHCHLGARATATADARSVALASLSAAIGQPVSLCEHAGDPSRPDDPADTGRCDHCIFCHSVAVGIAAAPDVAIAIARPATDAQIERPRADVGFARARRRGSATPRGPPQVG